MVLLARGPGGELIASITTRFAVRIGPKIKNVDSFRDRDICLPNIRTGTASAHYRHWCATAARLWEAGPPGQIVSISKTVDFLDFGTDSYGKSCCN